MVDHPQSWYSFEWPPYFSAAGGAVAVAVAG